LPVPNSVEPKEIRCLSLGDTKIELLTEGEALINVALLGLDSIVVSHLYIRPPLRQAIRSSPNVSKLHCVFLVIILDADAG